MPASAAQRRSDRRQDLPELIMEFAGNMPQRRFLCRDQFLRQIAALLGKLCQACKNLAITANQVQARKNNGDERCGQENIELALHTVVNLRFFFSSRRRHTRLQGDWSSDVCSSD